MSQNLINNQTVKFNFRDSLCCETEPYCQPVEQGDPISFQLKNPCPELPQPNLVSQGDFMDYTDWDQDDSGEDWYFEATDEGGAAKVTFTPGGDTDSKFLYQSNVLNNPCNGKIRLCFTVEGLNGHVPILFHVLRRNADGDFGEEIKICTEDGEYYEESALQRLAENVRTDFFDILTPMEVTDMYYPVSSRHEEIHYKFSPGKAKLSIYKYLHFDETILLDVDGVVVRDINSLFDKMDNYYHAQTVNVFTEDDMKWTCQWLSLEDVKKNFTLPEKFSMYEINSSFQYVKKSPGAELFFETAANNFKPELKTGGNWSGGFPDELAFNIATAQTQTDPSIENNIREWPIYFRIKNDYTSPRKKIEDLENEYYALGCYGPYGFTHQSVYDLYDTIVDRNCMKLTNRRLDYKANQLFSKI